MNSFQMIFKYWAKTKKDFIFQFTFLILSTIFYTFTPIFIGRMIGSLVNANELLLNFILVLCFAILVYIFNRAARLRGAEVSARAIYHLRTDISNAIYRQSFSFFDKTETGQLISRATSDIEETQMIFGMGLNLGFQSILQMIGVFAGFLLFSFELSIILIIAFAFSLTISYFIAKKLKPIFLETRESFGELTNTIRENIVGAEVVRMFSTQDKERQKFQKNNKRFYKASVDSVKFNSLYMPLVFVVIGFMTIITFFLGGMWYIEGKMALNVIITLMSYIASLGFPLVMLGQIMLVYVQADAALTRVREILDSAPEIEDSSDAIPLKSAKGEIIFENVSFGYTSEHRILKDVSFKIPEGKKLAILGTTGSGKSTIINLIPRFYEINKGTIKIDSIDIRNYVLKDLRSNIGLVSQETYLFNKSIADNIAYGKEDAKEEEIIEAAKIAELHDFITSLPNGYNSIVGERGTRLSGGQKQRLSIARALIVKPKILVFDDSTSSVDVETEFKIQEALMRIMKGTTTIIITQRISTIRNADLILILDRGRVVGLGNHEELIKSNVLYRQIFETLHQKQKSKGGIINE
ncbi:MAG: ABC transporter ATP-binding protein/permease [Candidatus Lokiarchaeota archaeon]|nr:ABC transporter ATP-binding protein/permease [Candidatus Lokiarchaeota archaeon]